MTLIESLRKEIEELTKENEELKARLKTADGLILQWIRDCNKPVPQRVYIKIVEKMPRKQYTKKKK